MTLAPTAIPTERTTAATDAVLCALAVACSAFVLRRGAAQRRKSRTWAAVFGLLALAAVLGTVAHGFRMTARTDALLWQPLNLALGLMIGLFAVAVVHDLRGEAAARRALWPMLAAGGLFYAGTLVIPGTFLVFVAYQALAMTFALVSYTWLAARRGHPGAWWMAAGVLVTMVAAGIQAGGTVTLHAGLDFDSNGVYHLVQIVGILLLAAGLREGLTSPAEVEHHES